LKEAPRQGHVTGIELAVLADAAFLRSAQWPHSGVSGNAIRAADLFCGCGAMTVGVWEACRAIGRRFEVVLAVDSSERALRTYRKNFPTARAKQENVSRLLDSPLGAAPSRTEHALVEEVGSVDVLVAGPPCQGHSDLNNYTRRIDPKNRLYERTARFAELVWPRHIIVENVPAVLHDGGRVVDTTVSHLCSRGYRVDHGVVDIASLGVAQHRRRHILLASVEREVSLSGSLAGYIREAPPVSSVIGDLLRIEPSTEFDKPSSISAANLKRIEHLFRFNRHDLPDSCRPKCHRLKRHTYKSVYGRMFWDRPAQTITSGFTCMGQGRFVHPSKKRTLTPHEAARLQFLPDFFRFGEDLPRTALAEMIANAVPPKLTYVLALELLR
jgi:DNA (cytosine-5)-methyltransferase 1